VCDFWHEIRQGNHERVPRRDSPALAARVSDRKVTEMFEQQLGRSVTIDQAAALLQVSRRTIYNRIRDGKLLTIRTIGGSQRVLLSSLDENRKIWADVNVEPSREPETRVPQPEAFALDRSNPES
jgi:excisionase family DNA binding protein